MCRNIKPLFNFDPPSTDDEVRGAALQFVRKISGFNQPSQVNEAAFNQAVDSISTSAGALLSSLSTAARPKDRDVEARRARARSAKRFNLNQ